MTVLCVLCFCWPRNSLVIKGGAFADSGTITQVFGIWRRRARELNFVDKRIPKKRFNINRYARAHAIKHSTSKVVFQWVPGHRGIKGNKEADQAAREAAKLTQEEAPLDLPIIKAFLKRYIQKKWKENFLKSLDHADATIGNKLYHQVTAWRPKPLPSSMSRLPKSPAKDWQIPACS